MRVSIQATRGSAENTFFPHVDYMYRILFAELKDKLGWDISFNSNPCVNEQFGPNGRHHTIIRIEGQKPIVIDERDTSYINPTINDFDAWFIIKYAYRDKSGFYENCGLGIDGDQKSMGGVKHSVTPLLGNAMEYGRWKTIPCEEWISNFDKDINLIFTGTDRSNRDTGLCRSQMCRSIEKHLPEMSYVGLHSVPNDGTSRKIDGLTYSNKIIKSLYDDYQIKMSRARAGLSLPGLGLSCYRECEYFAQCIPCIAPTFEIRYIDPLTPDFHYVNFDMSKPESFESAYSKLQDREFYNFISFNAWNWWQKNCNPKKPIGILRAFLNSCGEINSFRKLFKDYYNE